MGDDFVQTPTTPSRSPFASTFAASVLILVAFGTGNAQTANENDCDAVECMSPAFEVGVLYQSPVGHYGITELMYAVELDDLTKVELLLSSGAESNARNDSGATALLMASAYGQRKAAELLLAAGADPNIASNRGDTPLASAIQYEHSDIAVLLLQHGADPNVYHNADNPSLRKSVLVRAAVLGQTDVIRLLIEHGVDMNESGLEALNTALWQRHEDAVMLLVGAGVDLNAPTFDGKKYPHMQYGERVLHTAAQQGLTSSVQLLLRHGVNVNERNVREQSALYSAVKENHSAVVTLLLDAGAIVVADDVFAAFDAGNEIEALQLMNRIDLGTLGIAELDSLINRADSVNNTEILERLFDARELVGAPVLVSQLLFAKADTDECELILWDSGDESQESVYSSPGQCDQGFYFNRSEASLYVVGEDEVRQISLDNPRSEPRLIELPAAMIDANLSALKEQVIAAYNNTNADGMTAHVVDAGILASGDFAIVVHSGGPADETYGYMYSLTNNTWRLVEKKDCHRFDACRFDEIMGHSVNERPRKLTVWHPDIRRNPYFVEKTEAEVVYYNDVGWSGVVTLEIDGQRSLLHFEKRGSGHCVDDCVHTAGLALELPGQGPVDIAKRHSNNSIVGRYALAWTGPWSQCELIDLGTGESVFGKLQIAGWVH